MRRGILAGWLVVWLLALPAFATSWIPRVDAGVAGLDPATGQVRWEAWRQADLPGDLPKAARAAAARMLERESPGDEGASINPVRFPIETEAYSVAFAYTDAQVHELTLNRPSGPARIEVVGRVNFPLREAPHGFTRMGDLLLVLTFDNHVLAYSLAHQRGDWKPVWRFDPWHDETTESQSRRYPRAQLQVTDEGLLVSTDRRVVLLDAAGKAIFDHAISNPWLAIWDGFGHRVTLTKDHIWLQTGQGVMVLHRKTGDELWRYATAREPYVPLLYRSDDVVLVQIGSILPGTLAAALPGEAMWDNEYLRKQMGESTPVRQITAVRLLRAFGEGYPLDAVQQWLDSIDADSPQETQRVAAQVKGLLKDWPRTRSRQRLADACVAMLTTTPDVKDDASGMPFAVDRVLCWALLQELIMRHPLGLYPVDRTTGHAAMYVRDGPRQASLELDDSAKRALLKLARAVVADGPAEERPFAVALLVDPNASGKLLEAGELKRLAQSEHAVVREWAMAGLLQSGDRTAVIKLAATREEPVDRARIGWLLWSGLRSGDLAVGELDFWVREAKSDPGRVAYIFRGRDREAGLTPEPLYQLIRAWLEREIADPQVKTGGHQAAYDLAAALEVVASHHKDADVELLTAYRSHPVVKDQAAALLKAW